MISKIQPVIYYNITGQAMEKARQIINDAVAALDGIPPDVRLPTAPTASATMDTTPTETAPNASMSTSSTEPTANARMNTATNAPTANASMNTSTTPLNEQGDTVSAAAPPVSTTKGRRKNNKGGGGDNDPQPHFQRPKEKQKRRCLKCGKLAPGHNSASCARIQAMLERGGITKRPRGRPRGSGCARGTRGNIQEQGENVHQTVNVTEEM